METNRDQDQRSIANKLDAEERKEKEAEKPSLASVDPTAPALMHGHKPSKGAQIDKELMEEDEAQLKRKGKA